MFLCLWSMLINYKNFELHNTYVNLAQFRLGYAKINHDKKKITLKIST